MRLWTLQAPEVVAALRARGRYRAEWGRVLVNWRPAYRGIVAEMQHRGIDCAGAPPVWCWPGRALRRARVRLTADMLLGDDQWAHGIWLLKLDVPQEMVRVTSYSRWNDYLCDTTDLLRDRGMSDGPAFEPSEVPVDWRSTLAEEWDERQVTIPGLRREWLVRARHYPAGAETRARIAADPYLSGGRPQVPAPER